MKDESEVQQLVQIEAAKVRSILMRNNSGAFPDATGRIVRFGLGNNSEKTNAHLKSSDLIGITEVLITPEMVGKIIGVFTAVEVKKEDWKYKADKREIAQKNYIDFIISKGGIAFFANSVDSFRKSMMEFLNRFKK